MNTEDTKRIDATGISRRAMLGKSAKYAALITAASLIVTKANANGSFAGSSTAACILQNEHQQPPGSQGTTPTSHCQDVHGTT